jgi:hypothetical protein
VLFGAEETGVQISNLLLFETSTLKKIALLLHYSCSRAFSFLLFCKACTSYAISQTMQNGHGGTQYADNATPQKYTNYSLVVI